MDWDKVTALAKLTLLIILLKKKGIMWSIDMEMSVWDMYTPCCFAD
uniref:Uncharacterized protein n=1 Tax=Arundo donax TaxID=35708 RepID=A0A0A9NCT6_ARUDO